jgi:hypothetical protein
MRYSSFTEMQQAQQKRPALHPLLCSQTCHCGASGTGCPLLIIAAKSCWCCLTGHTTNIWPVVEVGMLMWLTASPFAGPARGNLVLVRMGCPQQGHHHTPGRPGALCRHTQYAQSASDSFPQSFSCHPLRDYERFTRFPSNSPPSILVDEAIVYVGMFYLQ